MSDLKLFRLMVCGVALIALVNCGLTRAEIVVNTVSFQNGVNGYAGTVDRHIGPGWGESDGAMVDTSQPNVTYFFDGGANSLGDVGYSQGLIRFDGLLGSSGVPAGATILSATLQLTTTNNGTANVQSNNAFNVYPLTRGFTSLSSALPGGDFAPSGLTGNVGGSLGSFNGMTNAGRVVTARVDAAVQNWANGQPNLGLGIRSDRGTDAWSVDTTGTSIVDKRPKLTVSYTTDTRVRSRSYQQGANGYAGTIDSFPNGYDANGMPVGPVNGGSVTEQFMDGSNGSTSSDQPYLIRFGNLDLAGSVVKAELVVKTGLSSNVANTPGPWSVHQILQPWDNTTSYASLDSDGDSALTNLNELQASGFIGAAVTTIGNVNNTQVVSLDVTAIVANWAAGQPNYGFYFGTVQTADGWQIFTSGALEGFAPELRIITVVPEPGIFAYFLACGLMVMRRR